MPANGETAVIPIKPSIPAKVAGIVLLNFIFKPIS